MDDIDVEVDVEEAASTVATDLTETEDLADLVEVPPEPSHESIAALHAYQIKPTLQDKFRGNPVKEIIRKIFSHTLAGKVYDSESAKTWTIDIANEVNKKVRDLKLKRYKHIVQVFIGEMKGAGIKSGVRCVWDSETDGYTSETFLNESIFCLVIVFAIYLY